MDLYPDYEIYSLRLDCSHNEHNETEIQKVLDKFEIEYYLFGRELGDIQKKPHYQGIVWRKQKFEKKALNLIRATIKNKLCNLPDTYYKDKKQRYSLRDSYKPDSLIKYCSKDGNIFTNVPAEKRELLENWVPKEEFKKKNAYTKKKELLKKIEELNEEHKYIWLHKVIELYIGIMGNLPRPATLEYYVYKYWIKDTKKKALWLEEKYHYVFGNAKELYQYDNGPYEPYPDSDDEEEYEDTEKKAPTDLNDYFNEPATPANVKL